MGTYVKKENLQYFESTFAKDRCCFFLLFCNANLECSLKVSFVNVPNGKDCRIRAGYSNNQKDDNNDK